MAIFYKKLLLSGELTYNEGLVYSTLLSQSQMVSEYFDRETKKVDYNTVATYVEKNRAEGHGETIICCEHDNTSWVADIVGLTRQTVDKILDTLSDKGYLRKKYIYCPLEVITGGYLKVPTDTKLSGRMLILYAILIDMAKKHGGKVTMQASNIGMICREADKEVIRTSIQRLQRGHFVKRLDNDTIEVKMPTPSQYKPRGNRKGNLPTPFI